jgi:protein translocase SecG subunit
MSASPAPAPSAAATINPGVASDLMNYHHVIVPKTPLAEHWPWLAHSFAGGFVVSAIALIVLLAVQTTKQEGLSGTIGGRVESAYRGRLGFDQQLARLTTFIAIVFVLFATMVSLSGF